MGDQKETGELIKKALTIVDKLGKIDYVGEYDPTILDLIDDAKKLTKNRLWKLK